MAKSASIAPYSLLPADNIWRLMFDVYGDGNENGKKKTTTMCFCTSFFPLNFHTVLESTPKRIAIIWHGIGEIRFEALRANSLFQWRFRSRRRRRRCCLSFLLSTTRLRSPGGRSCSIHFSNPFWNDSWVQTEAWFSVAVSEWAKAHPLSGDIIKTVALFGLHDFPGFFFLMFFCQ